MMKSEYNRIAAAIDLAETLARDVGTTSSMVDIIGDGRKALERVERDASRKLLPINDGQAKQFLGKPSGMLGRIKLYTEVDALRAIKRASTVNGSGE